MKLPDNGTIAGSQRRAPVDASEVVDEHMSRRYEASEKRRARKRAQSNSLIADTICPIPTVAAFTYVAVAVASAAALPVVSAGIAGAALGAYIACGRRA